MAVRAGGDKGLWFGLEVLLVELVPVEWWESLARRWW